MFKISRRKQPKVDLASQVPTPLITREKLAPYVEGARERVDTAREKVTPYVDTAREKVTPYVDTARERVTPYVEHAREWAGPRVEEAKHRAAPVVSGAVDKYVPKIEHALEDTSHKLVTVLESAGPARYEVQRRGSAAVAALKGELAVPEKKGGRWGRRFLVVGLFTGLGAAAFAFFRRRQDDDSWITSDTTYPTYGGAAAPSPTSAPEATVPSEATVAAGEAGGLGAGAAGVAATLPGDPVETEPPGGDGDEPIELSSDPDDAAGASPDEAAADADTDANDASDPDDPVERVTPKDVAEHIHPRET